MRENLLAVRLGVGATIRKLRRRRGWTQEQLAERVGLSTKHLGRLERGLGNVTIDVLTMIAGGLSVDITELFGPRPATSSQAASYPLAKDDLDQLLRALRIVERVERHGPE